MFFDSFSAALHMGGHGGFVWSAYLITLLVVIILLVAPWRRERALLREFAARQRRQQARPNESVETG